MAKVTLYIRRGCHLCDDMKALLDRVNIEIPFELSIIDIDTDDTLRAEYDWDVPVLLIDGQLAAKYRIDEATLRRRLA